MNEEDLCLRPLAEVAEMIRTRKLSAVAITEAVLRRIEQLGPKLNCYVSVLWEQALHHAELADRMLQDGTCLGPLHGIPIALKDNIATAGTRTTAGSPILQDWIPKISATVAERLLAAGAIIVAKANLYEFAYGAPHPKFGATHNPWSLDHTCGGSSSGSAAAVLAGLGYGSLGTDTGGSIRIPAAFCGVVGLKPTYGLVSRAGIIPVSYNLDHVGPLARTVRDVAILLDAIDGEDPRDRTTVRQTVRDYTSKIEAGVSGLRLGVLSPQVSELIDSEVRAAVDQACATLEGEGASLGEVKLPDLTQARTVMWAIAGPEAAEYHRPYLSGRAEEYHPIVRTLLEIGQFIPATEYVHAQRVRQRMIEEVRSAFADIDALVLPAVPVPAYRIGQQTVHIDGHEEDVLAVVTRYTALFNLTGQPALVVPCGFSSTGLPIGLQITGKAFDEATVLRVGRAYERSTNWHNHKPIL